MIKELCHRLKEKRCALGYSIEYTVEKTKIHPSAIRDIESGDLTNISPIYLRGFMRIYAEFLGVDLGTALEEINSLSIPNKKAKFIRKVPVAKVGQEAKPKPAKISPELKKKILLIVLGLVLLWILVVVGGKIIGGIAKIFKGKPKQETIVQTENITTPLVTKGELLVSLTVKRKCFLRVVVDGTLYFDGLLAKGARESWKGKKEIELKISDGSAVYLEVNGKSIPTLTSLRKPIKSLKVTHSGISVDK
ncbi:MAG: helix-turn-helix domain-containing protein [Candidatus Omnitrophica bacterium]|nr:helix-turn-helix domain-containing protein [Candidatus Omnitrophota bacterium]